MFTKLINKDTSGIAMDSLSSYYLRLLRDFTSVQNSSGYQTLKSKGLELISNDSLRTQIISLYENDYNSLRKLEEDYGAMQFFELYNKTFNETLMPSFVLNSDGAIVGFNTSVTIPENQRKMILHDLNEIKLNRNWILKFYEQVEQKISSLSQAIDRELK